MNKLKTFLCFLLVFSVAAVIFTGCGTGDGREKGDSPDIDWNSELKEGAEEVLNKKLNELMPCSDVALTYNEKGIDFTFDKVFELVEKSGHIEADLDAELEAGSVSSDIKVSFGDMEFVIRAANLSKEPVSLKDCVIVYSNFTSGDVTLASVFDLFSAKKDEIIKIFGEPFKESGSNIYYSMPAFGSNKAYYEGHKKYLSLEFRNGVLVGVAFVVADVIFHSLEENVEDDKLEEIKDLDEEKIITLEERKETICKKLKDEFDARGIQCRQNEETGAVSLDTSVLFLNNKSTLTDEGKEIVKKISEAYCSVILADDVKGYVSSVSFDGHANPIGTYERNLTLSKDRADEVRKIFLEGLSEEKAKEFENMSTAVGYSFNTPVYDSEGNIDYEGSRRVEIRFNLVVE